MMSCLEQIKDLCASVTTRCWHYNALDKDAPYCVWAEDSEYSGQQTDNYKGGQMVEGTIDYYTLDEDDANIAAFQNALNKAKIWWYLGSVQYEDETGFIHYEWVWRVRQELTDGNV